MMVNSHTQGMGFKGVINKKLTFVRGSISIGSNCATAALLASECLLINRKTPWLIC